MYVCLSVCLSVSMFPLVGHSTELIFLKLCMDVRLHPGSVLRVSKFTPLPVGVNRAWVGVVKCVVMHMVKQLLAPKTHSKSVRSAKQGLHSR